MSIPEASEHQQEEASARLQQDSFWVQSNRSERQTVSSLRV
jgi:hypothetical protein